MLTITYPKAVSKGIVPFHETIEDLLANDVEPVTLREIQKRLADRDVVATWNEVDRAIHYRREAFVNIRRGGFMLRSVYDTLPVKWFKTTDSIIEAAETCLRTFSKPASTEQIIEAFVARGVNIHGKSAKILRKSMTISGRFLVAGQQPTLWQLNPLANKSLRIPTTVARKVSPPKTAPSRFRGPGKQSFSANSA
jgi:hypothetical protein